MDGPQYVHTDVPSEYLCPWMFYDTHHMDMDVPEYVSPIKKKKREKYYNLKNEVKNIMKCELQISYKRII